MTPQQFKAARKACGMTMEAWFNAVAPERKDTGKKQIVHQWETGRMVLPSDVADRARALWQAAAKKSLIDSHGA